MLHFALFSHTKELERKIDELHNKMIDMSMLFKKAVSLFLKEKRSNNYKKLSKEIKIIEHEADVLRRDIESSLYQQNLIPEFRGDVLELVENLDKVLNEFDEVAHQFYLENPDIPSVYHDDILELVSQVCACAENLAMGSRAFFRDFTAVRDYSEKVYFYERASDKTTAQLKETVFASDIELAHKLQLSGFLSEVSDIADLAEDCVDQLLIYVIKRDI